MLVLISYEHAPAELAQAESLEELAKWWVGYWFGKSLHALVSLAYRMTKDIKKLVKSIAINQDLEWVALPFFYHYVQWYNIMEMPLEIKVHFRGIAAFLQHACMRY